MDTLGWVDWQKLDYRLINKKGTMQALQMLSSGQGCQLLHSSVFMPSYNIVG